MADDFRKQERSPSGHYELIAEIEPIEERFVVEVQRNGFAWRLAFIVRQQQPTVDHVEFRLDPEHVGISLPPAWHDWVVIPGPSGINQRVLDLARVVGDFLNARRLEEGPRSLTERAGTAVEEWFAARRMEREHDRAEASSG